MSTQATSPGLPSFIDDSLPPDMLKGILLLSPDTQALFVDGYRGRARTVQTSYLFWFVSLYYAYLDEWFLQFAFWLSWSLFFPGLIWWIVDAFRLQGLVRKHNEGIAKDVLRNIASIQAASS